MAALRNLFVLSVCPFYFITLHFSLFFLCLQWWLRPIWTPPPLAMTPSLWSGYRCRTLSFTLCASSKRAPTPASNWTPLTPQWPLITSAQGLPTASRAQPGTLRGGLETTTLSARSHVKIITSTMRKWKKPTLKTPTDQNVFYFFSFIHRSSKPRCDRCPSDSGSVSWDRCVLGVGTGSWKLHCPNF